MPGEMDIRSILVKTLANENFSLQDDPERDTTIRKEDGCALLKGSTIVDVCQEAMSQCYKQRGDERCRSEHGALNVDSIMGGTTREVTLNRVLHKADVQLLGCCAPTLFYNLEVIQRYFLIVGQLVGKSGKHPFFLARGWYQVPASSSGL